MIAKDRRLRRVCKNYEQVENYEKAVTDETQVWNLHHRRETDENKSMRQLKDDGKYYNVEPEELIFLTKAEHNKLHHKGKFVSSETKKKLSENHADVSGEKNPMYGMCGEKNPMYGRGLSGENHPMYGMCGEKNPAFGKHWWNDGKRNIFSKDCPGPDFVRGKLKTRNS